jgi:SAM-dependent methyltransferase
VTVKPQPQGDFFLAPEYDTKARFSAYWTQITEALRTNPREVLEIGLGNKLVSDYLKRRHIRVYELDLMLDIQPDAVGNVTAIPFRDNSFDLVMCCQVLEHLPYAQFESTLAEIARVARRDVLISLPNNSHALSISLTEFGFGQRNWLFDLSAIFPRGDFIPYEHHHWEIGWRGFPVRRIIAAMQSVGLHTERHFRVPERPYQHFFILRKLNS